MHLTKPQHLDAERSLIKCLLDNYELVHDITIIPEVFFGLDNAIVFKTIIELAAGGTVPDPTTIKGHLESREQVSIIGGDEYFAQLEQTGGIASNFSKYQEMIASAYLLRSIIATGNKLVDAGYSKPLEEATALVFDETTKLLDIAANKQIILDIETLMSDEFANFLERMQNPGCDGIPTMFPDFDLLTGGLYKTDEILIAARPSIGKTSLALRYMLNLARQDIPCLFNSYEMSHKQLMQRLLAMESKVNLSKIKNGMVRADEYAAVARAADAIGKLPIFVDNDASASVDDIINRTHKMIRSDGIEFLFIDYIQLMPHRVDMATQDLGMISRKLKGLAINTDTTVFLLSQLNRLVEMRTEKIPILSDLRQSGNLEEHADVVLMLYREEYYNPTENNRGLGDLFIRKNRNGPIGVLPIRFNAPTVDFYSTAVV